MVFKVLYQEDLEEVPVRERTESLYLEAESVRDVIHKLNDRNINIEHISPLDDKHLAYEKKSDSFSLENV